MSKFWWLISLIGKFAVSRDDDGDRCITDNDIRITFLGKETGEVTSETEIVFIYVYRKIHGVWQNKTYPGSSLGFPSVDNLKIVYGHYVVEDPDEINGVVKDLLPNVYKQFSGDDAVPIKSEPSTMVASKSQPALLEAPNVPCAVCCAVYPDNVRMARFRNEVRCWQHCY